MNRLGMHDLQELVRLHRMGTGCRQVSRLLKISPNTEREYRLALEAAGLLHGAADALPELNVLRAAVDAVRPSKPPPPQQQSSVMSWTAEVEALLHAGATPTAIYDRLRLEHADFSGSLSAIKRLCLRLKRAEGVAPEDIAIPVETDAGEIAQVDFGDLGKLWDPATGRIRQAYVFVMVLGHSRHQVCRVVFDQKIDTWLQLHVEAFEELGGVPRILVPDNLKAAVIRAAFGVGDDAILNRSYRELARHYGFKIDPTPPRSPEKKGKVESGVKYVKHNFFGVRRDEQDVATLRADLARWVEQIAGMRVHGTTRRRPREHFEQVERPTRLPLPTTRWQTIVWREPMLRRDCHVLVEHARYSAPWRLVSRRLLARLTQHSVELYYEDTRIATHERQPPGGHSTKDEHLPPERSEYRHRSQAYWEERALELGDEVATYIRAVFESDDVMHQLGKVQCIVLHLEGFPRERAAAACRRASYYGSYSYGAIKNILKKGLDLQALPHAVVPESLGVARPRFARTVQELLDLPLEDIDAPH
jgi:transposase